MRSLLIIVIAAVLSIIGTLFYLQTQNKGAESGKETAYERVLRTGTIRCGYGVGAPYVSMDPNTKQMKGFAVDVFNAIGKNLNLKVEWTEETGWGGMPAALEAGRIDVGCSSLWMSAFAARETLFSDVYVYSAMYYYVRADNDKFETLADLADKKARFGYVEGGNTQGVITRRMFPNNELVPYSPETQGGVQLLELASGKMDALLNEPGTIAAYNDKADVKLRAVSPDRPATLVGNAFPLGKGEVMLKNMIDTAIREMQASGELAQLMKPYQDAVPGAYFLPNAPYSLQR